VKRAVLLLLLSGCITSKGRVNVTATTGVWGGALIVGGAAVGAGRCEPSSEQCDHVERGDPAVATGLVLAGVSLMALAVLFHRSD
jgi:hypothetical protein